jgi:NADPH2 dehydrogenase
MSNLFSPITIKTKTFRNRVVMPPMVRSAPLMSPEVIECDGHVNDAVIGHYQQRARAGTGLIIVEATAVEPGGRVWRNGLNVFDDATVPGLAGLADAIHAEGAAAGIQIVHGGPQSSSQVTGCDVFGPSAVQASASAPNVRELTVAQIEQTEQHFAEAAQRAVQAGFDLVEVHGAHGYLLDSFLSTRSNRRTDKYGGDAAGRMGMLVETCRTVRERIGTQALLDCRVSVFNKLEEGYSLGDFIQLVRALDGAGIDVLHISTDGALRGYFGSDRTIQSFARAETRVPIIVAGGLSNPYDGERVVAEGQADFVAMGSAMLKDPEWTSHAREKLEAR